MLQSRPNLKGPTFYPAARSPPPTPQHPLGPQILTYLLGGCCCTPHGGAISHGRSPGHILKRQHLFQKKRRARGSLLLSFSLYPPPKPLSSPRGHEQHRITTEMEIFLPTFAVIMRAMGCVVCVCVRVCISPQCTGAPYNYVIPYILYAQEIASLLRNLALCGTCGGPAERMYARES